jgi:hypothetical protein
MGLMEMSSASSSLFFVFARAGSEELKSMMRQTLNFGMEQPVR